MIFSDNYYGVFSLDIGQYFMETTEVIIIIIGSGSESVAHSGAPFFIDKSAAQLE